jgi:mersacidin/lichenicidin family type 2 lantibiotic
MLKAKIVRAWKDPQYRASLSAEERANLPAHPAGMIELEPAALTRVVGGGEGLAAAPLKTYICVFCCSQVSKITFNL